jgi:hypothetical protein
MAIALNAGSVSILNIAALLISFQKCGLSKLPSHLVQSAWIVSI